jgi:hypothetical protein
VPEAVPLTHDGTAGYLITTDDVWVEIPLDATWTAAFRVCREKDSDPPCYVFGELRVFPRGTEATTGVLGGHWRADVLGFPNTEVPTTLPTSLIRRRLTGRTARAVLHKYLTLYAEGHRVEQRERQRRQEAGEPLSAPDPWLAEPTGHALQVAGRNLPDPRARRRTSRRGRGRPAYPDLWYAKLARDYVRFAEKGSDKPIAELVRKHRQPDTTIRTAIRTARKRDLLTVIGHGIVGGQLTQRAQRLLARNDR